MREEVRIVYASGQTGKDLTNIASYLSEISDTLKKIQEDLHEIRLVYTRGQGGEAAVAGSRSGSE